MVLGLGSDLIEIARIEASIARFGGRFLERVFTAAEIAVLPDEEERGGELRGAVRGEGGGSEGAGTGISRRHRVAGDRGAAGGDGKAGAALERAGAGAGAGAGGEADVAEPDACAGDCTGGGGGGGLKAGCQFRAGS